MEIYLVGGAVRDELLGRPVRERDWVVVGSTPEEMQRLGYRQVGRDFPVFLHPEAGEEYALARTERKTGSGHTGFVCHAGSEVTLPDDLARRDLTVNAMARDTAGALVDPFGGREDLEARVLRHVSEAFSEDPLRVFRVARFAAQLQGFQVAPETMTLMRRMARGGELAELSAERVWQELQKALAADAPRRFLEVLREADALSPWLEELSGVSWSMPEPLMQPEPRFAALTSELRPAAVRALCRRLKAPNRFRQLALQVAEHGRTLRRWRETEPEVVLDALAGIGALSPQKDPEPALTVVEACFGLDASALRQLVDRLRGVTAEQFRGEGLSGRELGDAIRRTRLDLLRQRQGSG